MAEEIDAFYPDSPYRNLIKLELDIASISDSVVLFSEGYGSFAELGAFSQIGAIAERILVFVQSYHHKQKSFIRDGPIRELEVAYPDSVQVFDWHAIDDIHKGGVTASVFDANKSDMVDALTERLSKIPKLVQFQRNDFGHKIILAACMIYFTGAASYTEVLQALDAMGITVTKEEMQRIIFCVTRAGWIEEIQRGHKKFYCPLFVEQPCDIAYREETPAKARDTLRWKRDIREHWKSTDQLRWRIITNATSKGSAV